MSQFDSSWMTCRQPHTRTSERIELLPRFSVPPEIHDFALETRPPHLPSRNVTMRPCLFCIGLVLCVVGSYSTVTIAIGRLMEHGPCFWGGVSRAVSSAIQHANQEAEMHAKKHYEAREVYLSKRRLSGDPKTVDQSSGRLRPAAKSTLLMRMAALRSKSSTGPNLLDDGAIQQLFPTWVSEQRHWNEEAVLKDLVLAVSQLANAATLTTDPRNGQDHSYTPSAS